MSKLNKKIYAKIEAWRNRHILPQRWIVERTIAWLNRCRRLANNWEDLNRKALAFLRLASIRLMPKLISAIVFALNNPITVGETYMLADSAPMTVNKIVAILRKMQGRSLTTIYVPQFIMRLSLMMCGRAELWLRFSEDLVVDTSKLELVGWRPVIDTYEGLRRVLRAEDGESARS